MDHEAKDSLSSTLCVVTTAITHNCRRDSNTLTPLMLCNLCVLLWTLCYKVAAIGIWSWFQWPQSFAFGWQQNILFCTWLNIFCKKDKFLWVRCFSICNTYFTRLVSMTSIFWLWVATVHLFLCGYFWRARHRVLQ